MININTLILKALEKGSLYGLEIINFISEKTNGELNIKQPSLYSALRRFENRGFVTSYWQDSEIGGRRHYYTITQDGLEYLKSLDVDEEIENTFVNKKSSFDEERENFSNSTAKSGNDDELFSKIEKLQEENFRNQFPKVEDDEEDAEYEMISTPFGNEMQKKSNDLDKTKSNKNDVDSDIDYKGILGELYTDDDIEKEEKNENINDIKISRGMANFINSNNEQPQKSKYYDEIEATLKGQNESTTTTQKKKTNTLADATEHLSTLPKKPDKIVQEIEQHYNRKKEEERTPFSTTEHYGKIDKASLKRNSYKSSAINKMEPRNYININRLRLTRSIIMSIIILIETGALSGIMLTMYADIVDNINYIILGSTLGVCVVYFLSTFIMYKSFPDKKLKNRPSLLWFNFFKRLMLIILLLAILLASYLMCGITFEKIFTIKYILYWTPPFCLIVDILIGFIVNLILFGQKKYYR